MTNEGKSHRDFSLTHCLPCWKCPSTGFHDTHSPCFLLTSQLTQIYCSSDSSSSFSHYLNIIFPCRLYLAFSSLYTLWGSYTGFHLPLMVLKYLLWASTTLQNFKIKSISSCWTCLSQIWSSCKPVLSKGHPFPARNSLFHTKLRGYLWLFFLSFPKCNCSICPVETTA